LEDQKKLSLQNLVIQIKEGDKNAFDDLYTQLFVPVYRFIFYKLHNKEQTEDIVQEVFIKFYRNIEHYQVGHISPLSYLIKIANNHIIDILRKNKEDLIDGDNLNVFEKFISERKQIIEKIEDNEDITVIQKAIKILPKDQRESILMKFVAELSYKEIAVELGRSEATIRQYVCRGLRKIRKYMDAVNNTGFKFKKFVTSLLVYWFI
jgi:RNA polymerase sigma-70 factor (ECF subfamily)